MGRAVALCREAVRAPVPVHHPVVQGQCGAGRRARLRARQAAQVRRAARVHVPDGPGPVQPDGTTAVLRRRRRRRQEAGRQTPADGRTAARRQRRPADRSGRHRRAGRPSCRLNGRAPAFII